MSFYMSAKRVIQEMSFDARDPLDPDVPPPASAPPPPPPVGDEEHINSQSVPLPYSSYQQQQQLPDQLIPPYATSTGSFNKSGLPASRPAPLPNITHYDGGSYEEDYSTNWLHNSSGSMLRGDAAIQPNTGLKNSSMGDGTALVEIIWKLQWINIIASTLAIMSEIFGIIFKLFTNPSKAILAVYLTFFSLMLLAYETRIPELERIVKDNFGLLCHPIGRALFLFLLSSLALGQWTLMDVLIGVVFLGNGIYTIHTFIFYPEFRRMHEDENLQHTNTESTWWSRKSWATPDIASSAIASTITHGLMNEREALLSPS